MSKNKWIAALSVLLCGLITGSIVTWLITSRYYKSRQPAILESLSDEFWENGRFTGDNTTAAQATQPSTTAPQKGTEPTKPTERKTNPYGGHKFILNTSSKKIHTPDCGMVKTINPENYSETDNFLGALERGYTQCKQCYPH